MNPLDGENILIYQIINGMNRASNWRKLAFTGKHWLALARDWRQLDETGENWSKLAKTGENWQKLAKTGKALAMPAMLSVVDRIPPGLDTRLLPAGAVGREAPETSGFGGSS